MGDWLAPTCEVRGCPLPFLLSMKMFIFALCFLSTFSSASTPGRMFPEGENLIYVRVLEAYRKGNIAELERASNTLIKFFPNSIFADNSYYLAGLLDLEQNRLGGALRHFSELERKYPKGNKRPAAMLGKSAVYERLDLLPQAESVLKSLIQTYPATPEGARAQLELKNLRSKLSAKK